MTNRFMISVAAVALIAGTSFANAQGMSREGSSGGAAVHESAPSSASAGTMNRDAAEPAKPSEAAKPSPGMKATQSEQKMSPNGARDMKGEKSAQDNNMQGQKSKSMSSENDNAKDNAKDGAKDMKAEGRNGNMNAESKGAMDSKTQTTGQAGAGAKFSAEQRTKITTVIRNEHVAPVTNINFSISVGTRVPREGVSFRPLPEEVVTIYPEWRGYEFFLVRDQIVVVDPRTFEIVAVLEA